MLLMVLTSIPGVSERMASKMTEHFGSEDAVVSTLASGDVARLAEFDGLSVKRALSLARRYAGEEGGFLATKEARRLHQDLLSHLQNFASCSPSSQRMALLTPVRNPDERREFASAALTLPSDWLTSIQQEWQGLGRPKEVQERYERVVVSSRPRDDLKRFCRVLQPAEKESWKDYTVFKTVTWIGSGAPMQAPDGWLVLGSSPEEALILPERTIDWFSHNRKSLNILCSLVEAYGRGEVPENAVLAKLIASLKELGELPE